MKRIALILIFCLLTAAAWAAGPITSAKYNEGGKSIHVVMEDGRALAVPDDMSNRHRRMLAEWESQGNTITAADPPPSPTTDAERIEAAFPETADSGNVTFEMLFELNNRLNALEDKTNGTAKGELTRDQLRKSLEGKLPK